MGVQISLSLFISMRYHARSILFLKVKTGHAEDEYSMNDEDDLNDSSQFAVLETDIGSFRIYQDGKLELWTGTEWLEIQAIAKKNNRS